MERVKEDTLKDEPRWVRFLFSESGRTVVDVAAGVGRLYDSFACSFMRYH